MIHPRRDSRQASHLNVGDGRARSPITTQPNHDRVADQRDRMRVSDSPASSAFTQKNSDIWQSQGQGPILKARLPEDPKTQEGTGPFWHWIAFAAMPFYAVLGIISIAIADTLSRRGYAYHTTSAFFWSGLLLIFIPIAGRILCRTTGRCERLVLVVLLGITLYLVKVLASPDGFTSFDEYIHWRSTTDILLTQHLFSFNPLLPTAAYYPGLAAITAALVEITGLNIFVSGLIIIGVARVLISACFFLIAERVTGSSRGAAGASLIYAANPMFLFWSSTFEYEDLGLPLAAFVIWWFGRTGNQPGRLVPIVTTISIVAITVTHHIAGFALAVLLGTWWLLERLARRFSVKQQSLGAIFLISGSTALIWFFSVARPAASYVFTDNVLPAFQQTISLITGHSASRQLYVSGGFVPPTWETFAGFAAVGLVLLSLPLALYAAWNVAFPKEPAVQGWRLRSRVPMVIAMVAAAAYPLSLIPRLTYDGVAISGRSSEYVFTGLGCVLGLLVEEPVWDRSGKPRHRRARYLLAGWRRTFAATCMVTVVFVGNITIGTAFYQRLPESSRPQGYPWTIQPNVITASTWTREHLGINQRFGANADDALALDTYGEQDALAENSIWPIFFANSMNEEVVRSIRSDRIHYLMVDWQMTEGVPPSPGYYFSPQEPNAGSYTRRFPVAALQKFNSNCTRLIYQSGYIQIFDLSRIESGSCT